MTDFKQRLEEVRRVLGRNDRWTFFQVSSGTAMQRWSWECGCMIDSTRYPRKNESIILNWARCGGHVRAST